MALTPDDVVNKRFQPTKFREGYDQDEVDDFLDEVVEELRRLTKDNDELRAQLADCQAGKASDAPVPAPVAVAATESKPEPVPAINTVKAAPAVAEPAAPAAAVSAPVASAAPAAGGNSAENAAGVLAMAQRLHDEYVSAGATERDRIVAEAETKAAGLVSGAEATARKTTSEAEETKRKTLAELDRQRTGLESEIEKLRGFERDYRSRLRTYIQGQLKDLDSAGPVVGEANGSSN
ncbi:DivIVA domain-containing protein [Galactobacter caseinivorans]|uniref:Cell wall synthesis protein Wag31 n=1 Tax=Galactobacter caseinivorans TaxID=2676123 RepID=A0A496PMA7_9MICC|nr:DivIVA domain-containing protein [Galactobacter caseinivorans]RKW71671.1 DivIVA domain-containing protein [Galactobacter caseinivorans]